MTYSPYTNNIFVWYVADTFQTIVTTWASGGCSSAAALLSRSLAIRLRDGAARLFT
ncbi:hypothetical protein [Escherichia coli]|uniref:hypothetical protein n=1 Tax=Escherichia coli TaxID=562 RepID=UPI0016288B6C|nr:hypothetical protein [Escherichia coli]